MHFPTRLLLLTLFAGAGARTGAQPSSEAPSATDHPVVLAPVRVTADLWESPLNEIPASVTVLDQQALRDAAVRHFSELIDQVPNLTWTGGTSRPRYFQIRGFGENSQYEGETPDSSVRFLVDDLDFTGLGSLASTFDVRQVEVLRGPQAGAFGANAAGGLIRLVTNDPTPFWTGQVEATVAQDDLRSGGLAVGGPLLAKDPQRLMMRFSLQQHESDGFRRNLTLQRDTNARDEVFSRLRLAWNPSELWRWDATLLVSDVDNGFDEFALDNNGRYTFSDQPGRDEQATRAASLRGTYLGWGEVRLTTVTSAALIDSLYSYDDDWTAASYRGFSELTRERTIANQEIRLDSNATEDALGWIDRWTLGAFFARTDESSRYTNEDPANLRGLATEYRSDHYALFGQVAHDLSTRTRVLVGLRGEHVALRGDGTRTRFRKTRGTFDAPVHLAPRFSDELFGGKMTLEHQLAAHRLLFLSVTRGYKAGGINIDARINPAADPLVYATEHLWNFEAGLRGHALQQRLRGEVVVFHTERRDTQVRDSAGFGGNYRFFTDNANAARTTGVETSLSLDLTPAWTIRASLGLMDSDLSPFVLANGNSGGGRRLANTPKYGYSLGLGYRPEQGWLAHVEWSGRAAQFDSNNQNEARRAYDVVHATLGYRWRSWTFTLWARNLADAAYDKRVFFFGNEEPDYTETRYATRADPRQVGLSVRWDF